ncbi:MAG: hypothetical protein DI598_10860 [Pseudopedobacter saltans]|uniref:Signal transduction histidine kinase internal region domain-containing protein n=1 Tax=Pseudopedobacter saltans TaxID=151895 RepID=A0A2W5F069_9SPHI|nr:MAG: hypothetical protein DI598_10860 [Pseudopedobacter saltans]
MSIKKDDRTSNAILNLSGIMRYITTESREQKIPFKKELAYINDYLELQKARLGNTVCIDYQSNVKIKNQTIAPLILITFIENAFKYGVNPNQNDSKIILNIQLIDNQLDFHIFNKKLDITRDEFKSNGIGLKNTMERLKSIYPNKHHLTITELKESYNVKLTMDLL